MHNYNKDPTLKQDLNQQQKNSLLKTFKDDKCFCLGGGGGYSAGCTSKK